MRLPYVVVDVFTKVPLEGNPLAVFPDPRGIDTGLMQRIAKEMNLSETVFFEPADLSGCVQSLRIFTPSREMRFAGHPTIGASYILLSQGFVPPKTTHFDVQEKVGRVSIRVEPGDLPLIWLRMPPITFAQTFDNAKTAAVVGLAPSDLLDVPPQLVTAGNPTLLVAARDPAAVDRAEFDLARYHELVDPESEPLCFFIFAPTDYGAYSRMFAPELGVVEDPATGSSTGPLAAYMQSHGLLPNKKRYISEQGTKMARRSLLHFEVSDSAIDVGGHVTPVIEGVLTI